MASIDSFFEGLANSLEGWPKVADLRDIRDYLDDPAVADAVKEYVRGINDPDRRVAFMGQLRKIRREAEARGEKRKLHKDLTIQIGVVGGVGLIGASLVAVASATFPAIVVIPVVGGAWTAFQGFIAAERFDEERQIYEQIAAEIKNLLEVLK